VSRDRRHEGGLTALRSCETGLQLHELRLLLRLRERFLKSGIALEARAQAFGNDEILALVEKLRIELEFGENIYRKFEWFANFLDLRALLDKGAVIVFLLYVGLSSLQADALRQAQRIVIPLLEL
jgi:hypothetical protein